MNTLAKNSPPPGVKPDLPPIQVEELVEGIVLAQWDRRDRHANILDSHTLQTLAGHLEEWEQRARDGSLRGLIFWSAKPSVFIAGADIRELAQASNPGALVDLGQKTFSRLAALPVPTIAAIHGVCAGGGLELALACTVRIASRDPATRIGFPEVQLGLLPAWGGCTRLPRLVGLSKALAIILGSRLYPGAKAKRLGLVDALVPRERLITQAQTLLARGSFPHRSSHLWDLPFAPILAAWARRKVEKLTGGNYPAPLVAIGVVTAAQRHSISDSLAAEKSAILKLAATDACHNLLRVFLLQDRAKHLPAPKARTVRKTAVIGAGVMGSGIAQWIAARGWPVVLRDVGAEPLARGLQRVERLFSQAQKRGLMTATEARAARDRLVPSAGAGSLARVDLVVEAAVERMGVKKALLAALEIGPETIFATNTSALSITTLAATLPDPSRLVGMHFFNPVHRMKLVEVVRTEFASPEAVDTVVAFTQAIGKFPVIVRDSPGFLVNRLLLPYLLEAVRTFEGGVDMMEIDRTLREFGMPMGPLRLLDEIGLDVAAEVGKTLCGAFPDRLQMPTLLENLDPSLRGRKSGLGFYRYKNGHVAGVNPKLSNRRSPQVAPDDLAARLLRPLIEEAARCLDEKVVADPETIDFAMIMGTGFAPFRGGPLRTADAEGWGPSGRKFYPEEKSL